MSPEFRRFVEQVREMRHSQRAYFKTRERRQLEDAWRLERQVDKAISDMEAVGQMGDAKGQLRLF